jgi:DNA-binding CsgD family transcriptional regulator
MQILTANLSINKNDKPNWNQLLQEFNSLNNTFINLYDPKKDEFVFVNKCFDQLPINQAKDILGKGLDSWVTHIHKADLKKAEMLFLTHEKGRIINYQNIQNRLYYRIINENDRIIYVLHEQKYIKAGSIHILNMITDITEKMTANRLANKLNIELNPNDSENSGSHPKEMYGEISGREHEVLQLIATGLSSKEIADKLFISNHTAISHRKNLIEKFNVKNTAELIKEASQVLWLC